MNRIMCHVVAGYPDAATCLELLLGMQTAGVTAVEVQIPFSDPIADGPTIMRANDMALSGGMTTTGSFDLLTEARRRGLERDLYVMSYIQKLRHFGFEKFCRRAAACQTKGLIVPDLPYDSDEFNELVQAADRHGLTMVPVLSPGMAPARLKDILERQPPTVYVTSVRGITGNHYAPDEELARLVAGIRRRCPDAEIMIGFGIASPRDVREALRLGDTVVIGSAFIKQVETGSRAAALKFITQIVAGQS